MVKNCTVHQVVSSGMPVAQGSEVRLPSGQVIPGVLSVTMRADAGDGAWITTIELHATFGDPIDADAIRAELADRWASSYR